MDLADIILLSLALGIDCLIVSFSQGLIFKSERVKNALKLSLTMGFFQGFMPVIGYFGTQKIYDFLVPYSKWIVFTIFFILGANFIIQSFKREICEKLNCIDFKCLAGLGIATSIDALISGANLKLTHTILWLTCLVIGLGSFLMSQAGFWSGNFIKNIRPKILYIIGGLILIELALKSVL